MKAWKKVVIASIVIVLVIVTGIVAYAYWYALNNHGVMRPFVYSQYDWNTSSGFRTEVVNNTKYYVLSPGQNGSVNVTFNSVSWIDYDQTLTFSVTTGNLIGNPALYTLPNNVNVAIVPPTLVMPKNASRTLTLMFYLPENVETGTWYFTLDVGSGNEHFGMGFDFTIKQ